MITGNGVIVWDGVTRPEADKQDATRLVHSMRVAMQPGSPEIAELTALAQKALNEDSVFKGVMPPGGNWPVNTAGVDEIDASVNGFTVINAKTRQGAPQVFDASGKLLDPMQYGAMLYPGAVVQLLLHAYSFNNVSKGVAFGLDGIKIIDATTPKLAISGGIDAAKYLGGAAAAPAAAGGAAPPPPADVAPAPDFLNPPPPPAEPVMTAKAGGATYQSFIAQGWTEDTMRQNGYII
jgi:hypothetical protein